MELIVRQRRGGKTVALLEHVINLLAEQDDIVTIVVPDASQRHFIDEIRRAGLVDVEVVAVNGDNAMRLKGLRHPTVVDNFDMLDYAARAELMSGFIDLRAATKRSDMASELARAMRDLLSLREQVGEAELKVALLTNQTPPNRSIEDHIDALRPREGFEVGDITDHDRHEIARAVVDAWLVGTAWITRDADHGFKREDPLRVEIRDRRMT